MLNWDGSKSTSNLDGHESHQSARMDMPVGGIAQINGSTSKLLKHTFFALFFDILKSFLPFTLNESTWLLAWFGNGEF